MQAEKYEVTCKNCGGHDTLTIVNGREVMYKNHTPIISARFRGDLKFGFECLCGNDSRLARSERPQIETLVRGGEHAIEAVKESLLIKDEDKFQMVKV